MSVRVKDMCTVVEVPMDAIYELGPMHICVEKSHFTVLKEVVEHLERDA